jgi:hypothetical protein
MKPRCPVKIMRCGFYHLPARRGYKISNVFWDQYRRRVHTLAPRIMASCGLVIAEPISMVVIGLLAIIDSLLDMPARRAKKREFGSSARALLHCNDTDVSEG